MRYIPALPRPEPLVLHTLIVDGKKMSIGPSSAFKHFKDFAGVTMPPATTNDIANLPIHPGTPARVKKQIQVYLDSLQHLRCPNSATNQS